MALSNKERLLVEAVSGMMDDIATGTNYHKKSENQDLSNSASYLHEEIEQAYRLATVNLDHHDSVCSAFSKIHNHKYLDDPSFTLSFEKELTARAVPMEEREKAVKAIDKVRNKLLKEKAEQDAGFNPELDEIIKVSQPGIVGESKLPFDRKAMTENVQSDGRDMPYLVGRGSTVKLIKGGASYGTLLVYGHETGMPRNRIILVPLATGRPSLYVDRNDFEVIDFVPYGHDKTPAELDAIIRQQQGGAQTDVVNDPSLPPPPTDSFVP